MKKAALFFVLLGCLSFCACDTQFSLNLVQKTRSRAEVQSYFKQKAELEKKGAKFLLNNYPHDYVSLNISIGTPPQNFEVAIETGRPDLWVLWQYFDNALPGQHLYSPENSTTSSYYSYFEGRSADLLIYGESYKDRVKLGELSFDQIFGTATDIYKYSYTEFALEGVLGLSWNPNSEFPSPIQNAFNVTGIEDQVYTIWLGPHVKPSQGNGEGKVVFGFNGRDCNDTVNFVHLDLFNTYMAFYVSGFTFGKYSSAVTKNGVVDSGFPLVLFDTNDYRAVYRQINPDYDWDDYLLTVDCDKAANFSDWEFTINGQVYSIPSSQYVIDLELENGQCAVAVGINEDVFEIPSFVLGNVFLRQYCTTYNIDTSQLGLSASLTGDFN